MTALTMPQAASLAETTPLNHRDRQYRAEGIAGRICDIRNLLIAMDHVQQDRITGYAEHAQLSELVDACDQIASMHVIAVEVLETTGRQAEELASLLCPPPNATWNAAVARWQASKAEAEDYRTPFAVGAREHNDETIAESDGLDLVQAELLGDLMNTPAPDLAALRFKLEHLLEDDNGSLNPWSDSYVDQTRRDIARLLGEG